MDVHAYAFLARHALSAYHARLGAVVFEHAFTLQGNAAGELPEQVLGAARIYRTDFDACARLADFQGPGPASHALGDSAAGSAPSEASAAAAVAAAVAGGDGGSGGGVGDSSGAVEGSSAAGAPGAEATAGCAPSVESSGEQLKVLAAVVAGGDGAPAGKQEPGGRQQRRQQQQP